MGINYKKQPKEHYIKLATSLKNFKTLKEFIKEAKKIHGDKYDYSKVDYKNGRVPLIIICKKHGEFKQSWNHHRISNGCPECYKEYRRSNPVGKYGHDTFLIKANKKHNNQYEYLSEYIGAHTKIKVRCKKCDGIFYPTPGNHLFGTGCPRCKQSKAEKIIERFLIENKIFFNSQYYFLGYYEKMGCRSFFDFYLPNYNLCIEYDGEQHFMPKDFSHGKLTIDEINEEFNKIKQRDLLKNKYCKDEGIKLFRINYKQRKYIVDLLKAILNII